MFKEMDRTETYELSPTSARPDDDHGALLHSNGVNVDDYTLIYRFVSIFFSEKETETMITNHLFFRRRQTEKRSIRFCLCCIFLSALILSTIVVFFGSYFFHPRQEHPWQDQVRIELIWTSAFPKLITESAFRLVDCNSDGILDVIFGYGTGVDSLESNPLLCDLYFNGNSPCNGGVKVN